ncbi:hypothetical protein CBS101457_001778 [Exobasidium rhododendri]|nr:hypothetical protein CBS101457_001778 [Exobasidium rhododendri]
MAEEEERRRLPALGRGRGAGSLSLGIPRGGRAGVSDRRKEDDGLAASSSASTKRLADNAIRSTDNDAVGSRIAAIQHHYLESDPYSLLLGPTMPIAPRPPIINIGTYLRCRAIDTLVDDFLDGGSGQKQIISLGAGSDSRFWRLQADSKRKGKLKHYVELDFAELTISKVEKIVRHRELLSLVSSSEEDVHLYPDRSSIQSKTYSLLACDLRLLDATSSVDEKLKAVLNPDLDTLILAECVLAYLSPASSSALLRYLATLVYRPCAVCYEMCVAGDVESETAEPSKFGTVMLNNLQARSLSMPGSRTYSTVASQAERFQKAFGKDQARPDAGEGSAITLKKVWQTLDNAQKQRLSRLQGLDEVEELEMLLSHYAVSWYNSDIEKISLKLQSSI